MNHRRTTWRAFAISAVLHLAIALITWNSPLLAPPGGLGAPARAADEEDYLELTLEPDAVPPGPDESDETPLPTAYTDVPERHAAATPPDRADFLALHDSHAADMLPGGEKGAPPGSQQTADLAQVEIRREDLEGAPGVVYLPPGGQPPPSAEVRGELARPAPPSGLSQPEPLDSGLGPLAGLDATQDEGSDLFPSGEPEPGRADDPTAGESTDGFPGAARRPADAAREGAATDSPANVDSPARPWPAWPDPWSGAPSLTRPGSDGTSGDRGFEFQQRATSLPGANTITIGDFSLNTVEWAWAPWMQRFSQDLRRAWVPPYAYLLGIISGRTTLRIVIEKDGRLGRMAIEKTDGHESLHKSSEAALTGAAPFAPLPPNFPEPNLVIILTLIYPDWKSQLQEQERVSERPADRPAPPRGRR